MKGVKRLCGLLLVLFTIFGLSLSVSSNDASAIGITSILSSQSEWSQNFESSNRLQTLQQQNVPAQILGTNANLTGFWDYRLNFTFPNPVSNHTGTGFNHSIRFTLTSNANIANSNITNLLGSNILTFELNGSFIKTSLPYCSSLYRVVSLTSNSIRFEISNTCPAGSLSSTNFGRVGVRVRYTPDTMFWCANDNPSQMCPSTPVYITISDIDYNFELLTTSQDSTNQTIINQNQTIINQNQYEIDQNNQDRADLQNASDSASGSAEDAGEDIAQGGEQLLYVLTNFFDIFFHPPASNCIIDGDTGFMDLGDIDLCELNPPPAISVLATLLMIGAVIPLCVSGINTLIKIVQEVYTT